MSNMPCKVFRILKAPFSTLKAGVSSSPFIHKSRFSVTFKCALAIPFLLTVFTHNALRYFYNFYVASIFLKQFYKVIRI